MSSSKIPDHLSWVQPDLPVFATDGHKNTPYSAQVLSLPKKYHDDWIVHIKWSVCGRSEWVECRRLENIFDNNSDHIKRGRRRSRVRNATKSTSYNEDFSPLDQGEKGDRKGVFTRGDRDDNRDSEINSRGDCDSDCDSETDSSKFFSKKRKHVRPSEMTQNSKSKLVPTVSATSPNKIASRVLNLSSLILPAKTHQITFDSPHSPQPRNLTSGTSLERLPELNILQAPSNCFTTKNEAIATAVIAPYFDASRNAIDPKRMPDFVSNIILTRDILSLEVMLASVVMLKRSSKVVRDGLLNWTNNSKSGCRGVFLCWLDKALLVMADRRSTEERRQKLCGDKGAERTEELIGIAIMELILCFEVAKEKKSLERLKDTFGVDLLQCVGKVQKFSQRYNIRGLRRASLDAKSHITLVMNQNDAGDQCPSASKTTSAQSHGVASKNDWQRNSGENRGKVQSLNKNTSTTAQDNLGVSSSAKGLVPDLAKREENDANQVRIISGSLEQSEPTDKRRQMFHNLTRDQGWMV